MQLTTLAGVAFAALISLSPPPADPVAVQINLRKLTRSQIRAAVNGATNVEEQRAALRRLAVRELLLQEAERSGLGKDLPTDPNARAEAFLKQVVSERVVCSRMKDRELSLMYRAMRPRFVHGHLYRLAELRLSCWEPSPGCAAAFDEWTREHWGPVLEAIQSDAELHMLWEMTDEPPGVIRYVEYTLHVDDFGQAAAPDVLLTAVKALAPGQAALTVLPGGVRAPLLVEYEPPRNLTLNDPSVAQQVRNELCPRVVKKNREAYVDNLLKAAYLKVHRDGWPAGVPLLQ